LVDDEDFEWLNQYKWFYHDGYAIRREQVDGKQKIIRMHRELLGFPFSKEVDHINRIRNDNQRKNLRICERRQNAANRAAQLNNKSKYKGVFYCKRTSSWMMKLKYNDINITENYINELAAANAYNFYSQKYCGEFGFINDCPIIDDWNNYRAFVKRKENCSSKYKGVHWSNQKKKWIAKVYQGKEIYLGSYNTEEEAYLAYNSYLKEVI
jgi:hypothetical protein